MRGHCRQEQYRSPFLHAPAARRGWPAPAPRSAWSTVRCWLGFPSPDPDSCAAGQVHPQAHLICMPAIHLRNKGGAQIWRRGRICVPRSAPGLFEAGVTASSSAVGGFLKVRVRIGALLREPSGILAMHDDQPRLHETFYCGPGSVIFILWRVLVPCSKRIRGACEPPGARVCPVGPPLAHIHAGLQAVAASQALPAQTHQLTGGCTCLNAFVPRDGGSCLGCGCGVEPQLILALVPWPGPQAQLSAGPMARRRLLIPSLFLVGGHVLGGRDRGRDTPADFFRVCVCVCGREGRAWLSGQSAAGHRDLCRPHSPGVDHRTGRLRPAPPRAAGAVRPVRAGVLARRPPVLGALHPGD